MSIIIVKDEAELKEKFIQMVYIIRKMRIAQKTWHTQFGSTAKKDRERWEEKADEFIEGIEMINPDKRDIKTLVVQSEK